MKKISSKKGKKSVSRRNEISPMHRERNRDAGAFLLACKILEWDSKYQGETDCPMEVTGEEWEEWIRLSGVVTVEKTRS